jgi:15-cis-phytoene synthase
MSDSPALAASFAHCRNIARSAARNFYFGFLLLPEAKRNALCALYAFMRHADDIADEPGSLEEKRKGLRELRGFMDGVLSGHEGGDPMWPAFQHTILTYKIPPRYLHDLISGTEMDLEISSYDTFDALREYCYRVAGAVGLCCLHVFGFSDPRAPELAERMGIAFQLTNILRDLSKDYMLGRVYLPQEDFRKFGCDPDQFDEKMDSAALASLIRFEVERAWQFYRDGWKLVELVDSDSRAALWALASIYSGILERIERRNFAVMSVTPVRLSTPEKVWILVRARMGWFGKNNGLRNRDRDRRRAGGAVGRSSAR